MPKVRFGVLSFIAVAGLASAQGPDGLQFEAASFKRTTRAYGPVFLSGGPGTSDPGRISYSRATLHQILDRAFGVAHDQISGPGWIDSERYEVVATLPPATTADDFKLMLQRLLADRLRLVIHHASRNFSVYLLTVSDGGSKLTRSANPGGEDTPPTRGHYFPDEDGCPVLPPGFHGWDGRTDAQGMECDSYGRYTLPELTHQIADLMAVGQGRSSVPHVINRTGLKGRFDFTLRFRFQVAGSGMATLTKALEQLGLSLRKSIEPLDVVVVDKAERVPTSN